MRVTIRIQRCIVLMMPREEEGDGEEEGAGGDGSDDSEVDEPPVGEA